MQKTGEFGYFRYDLRWDPTFMLKVYLTELICPSHHIGELHRERIEREYVTDVVEECVPTLEDLGVQLTKMEDQVSIREIFTSYNFSNSS